MPSKPISSIPHRNVPSARQKAVYAMWNIWLTESVAEHSLEILGHRTEGKLGVIDAQIAVLVRRVKGPENRRAKVLDEVLSLRAGVLQGHGKVQALDKRSLIALQPGQIRRRLGDPTR